MLHQQHSTPGHVGEALALRGYRVECRWPLGGAPLPHDLTPYAAVIVFGGPQSANDDHLAGIRAELAWLERCALPSGLPLLGICLGAQEIARVLGARVHPHAQGLAEIGYCTVAPTAAGATFLTAPTRFYQWHAETFEIPPGAAQLASGEVFAAQAYRYGRRVVGLEFHPEMTAGMITRWATSEAGRAAIAHHRAPDCLTQLADHARYAAASRRWLARFLDDFLAADG